MGEWQFTHSESKYPGMEAIPSSCASAGLPRLVNVLCFRRDLNFPKNLNSSHRVHRVHRERNGNFHVLLDHLKGESQFRDNRLFLLCDLCVLCG
jgi:hypothetical protein